MNQTTTLQNPIDVVAQSIVKGDTVQSEIGPVKVIGTAQMVLQTTAQAGDTIRTRVVVTVGDRSYSWHLYFDLGQLVPVQKAPVKLTKAQASALREVQAGLASYVPGRDWGPRSTWTRYKYEAFVPAATGFKNWKRRMSVDMLVELGLVAPPVDYDQRSEAVLTSAGRAWLTANPL